MGDQHDRLARPRCSSASSARTSSPDGGVQRAGRLVGQQQRPDGSSAPGRPRPAAARRRTAAGVGVGVPVDAEVLPAARRRACVPPPRGMPASCAGSSTLSATVRSSSRLKNWKTMPIFARRYRAEAGLAQLVDPQSVDRDGARARPVEPGDQVEQRRLAAAGRPEDGDCLAGAHGQCHISEGRRPLPVRPGHIADVDDGRGLCHSASTGGWSTVRPEGRRRTVSRASSAVARSVCRPWMTHRRCHPCDVCAGCSTRPHQEGCDRVLGLATLWPWAGLCGRRSRRSQSGGGRVSRCCCAGARCRARPVGCGRPTRSLPSSSPPARWAPPASTAAAAFRFRRFRRFQRRHRHRRCLARPLLRSRRWTWGSSSEPSIPGR